MNSKFDLKESCLYTMTTRDQTVKDKFDLKESLPYRMATRDHTVKDKFDLKESLLYRMANRGRPSGTTKDPNRKKVLNQNGRCIDYAGPQYNKLIKEGYSLTYDNKLVKDPNASITKKPRGRPKTYTAIATADKVRNPETGE